MKIYVASSWRNTRHSTVVTILRGVGHDVYDFKNPEGKSFHWSEIDPDWQKWGPGEFQKGLDHPLAVEGFAQDKKALDDCEVCVLLLPCGRSAHLEAGYAVGQGKPTYILLSKGEQPELMYKFCTPCLYIGELVRLLKTH